MDVKLSESQWLQPGDLAVLTAERGAASAASRPDAAATLQGLVRSVRAAQRARATEAKDEGRRLCVEVELSKVAQLARDVQKLGVFDESFCNSLWFFLSFKQG